MSNATTFAPFCHPLATAIAAGVATGGQGPVFTTFTLPNYVASDAPFGQCVTYFPTTAAPFNPWTAGTWILFLPILLNLTVLLPTAVFCGIKLNARGMAIPFLMVTMFALITLMFFWTQVCFHWLNLYTWTVGVLVCLYGLLCGRHHHKPGSCCNTIATRRCCGAKKGKGWSNVHTWVFGRFDEYKDFSIGEWLFLVLFVGWLAVTFGHYYSQYASPAYADSGLRAAGKAISQVNVKLLVFNYLSANKNTFMWHYFSVSPERGYEYHKQSGRYLIFSIVLHVILMVASGEISKCVQWSDSTDLNRPNLWPGVIGLFLAILTGVTAIPSIRRRYFEWFYFNHVQVSFPIGIMTIIHARSHFFHFFVVAIWFFQIDVMQRLFTKRLGVKVTKFDMVTQDILRIEMRRTRYGKPSKGDKKHNAPGAYLWLGFGNLNQSEEASGGGGLPPLCLPPGSVFKLPSFLMYHPITIASAPGDDKWIVYIKSGAPGQWSHALCDLAMSQGAAQGGRTNKQSEKKNNSSEAEEKDERKNSFLPLLSSRTHIGGPSGGMRMRPQDYSVVVLCVGGVGASLATAILGAIKENPGSVKKVYLLWSGRTNALFRAFEQDIVKYTYDVSSYDVSSGVRNVVEYDLRAFRTRKEATNGSSPSAITPLAEGKDDDAPVSVDATRQNPMLSDMAASAAPTVPMDAFKKIFDECSNGKGECYLGQQFYGLALKLCREKAPNAVASFENWYGSRAEVDKGKGMKMNWSQFQVSEEARIEFHSLQRSDANAMMPGCLQVQPHVVGRPDYQTEFRAISKASEGKVPGKFVAMYACGPTSLMVSASQAAEAMNGAGKLTWHHHEELWEF